MQAPRPEVFPGIVRPNLASPPRSPTPSPHDRTDTEVLPKFDAIKAGELWISHKHRTVNLRCPCGCGDLTVLSLHPSRCHIHFDGKSVSLDGPTDGSVWANSGCGSHYLIRENAEIWLDRIDPGRHSDYADIERARLLASKPSRQSLVHAPDIYVVVCGQGVGASRALSSDRSADILCANVVTPSRAQVWR